MGAAYRRSWCLLPERALDEPRLPAGEIVTLKNMKNGFLGMKNAWMDPPSVIQG